jgi:hypothetical protein
VQSTGGSQRRDRPATRRPPAANDQTVVPEDQRALPGVRPGLLVDHGHPEFRRLAADDHADLQHTGRRRRTAGRPIALDQLG